jgi:protein-L-isoaspartate(D-aspartate) O-methyltransferase
MNFHFKRDFGQLRSEMVEKAIFARGVRSELVLNAMRSVPREVFLPEQLREFAYEDAPLPIEGGQTISQPYIVAFMTEALALEGGGKVLEIGAGSGYAAAILSKIAGEVYTVERIGSSRRRQRPSWPISATTMCAFFTGTEPRDGRSMLLMMASLLPLAGPAFLNH